MRTAASVQGLRFAPAGGKKISTGYIVLPYGFSVARAFESGRKFFAGYMKSNRDSFEKALVFWKEAW